MLYVYCVFDESVVCGVSFALHFVSVVGVCLSLSSLRVCCALCALVLFLLRSSATFCVSLAAMLMRVRAAVWECWDASLRTVSSDVIYAVVV